MSKLELKDVVDKISADNKAVGDSAAATKQDLSASGFRPLMDDLMEASNGSRKVAKGLLKLIGKSGILWDKDVTTVDIGPVRIDSLYPVIAEIINTDHPLLNVLMSKPRYIATDYSIRIPEEDVGDDILSFFNMDGSMPAVLQSILSERHNTLGALGQRVKVSWMTQELGKQSPYNRDEDARQLMGAMNRLARSMNQYIWENTEQTGESVLQIPQPGGFSTRSTTNVADIASSNLTDVIITGMVDDIASFFGYNGLDDLVLKIPRRQLEIVRSLMINRYPGTDPMSKMQYDNSIAARAASYGYPVDTLYVDNNNKVIPCFVDDQSPDREALMFRAKYPQLAGFKFRGSTGPHFVQLPIALFYEDGVLFDLFSVIDPLQCSRAKRTAVGV